MRMAVIARSGATKQSRREGSVRHGSLRRLHHGFDDVCADLLPHLAASDRRKAVMKAGADAGVGDLLGKGPQIGEAMRDSWEEGARQCNFRGSRRCRAALG